MKSVVVLLKTSPETVIADISQAFEQANVHSALDPQKTTILKDNISWHLPFLGANTTPWQLEGTIVALKRLGFNDLISVHNNTVVTDPHKGQRLNKLAPIYRKYGVKEFDNFNPEQIRWVPYEPKTPLRALDRIFRHGIRLPDMFFGKNIVHLPTMKTHIYTTTTGAMKNAFGGLLNSRRHYAHSFIHETLVDLLAIQKEIHSGLFALIDGTVSGSGPGPRTMTPHDTSLLIAGSDMVAVDALSSWLMGFEPMDIPYIRMAHEAGFGCGRIEEIEVIGEDPARRRRSYTVGDNLASRVGDRLWFGPLKVLQRFLFHTPLVYLFIFGSYFYHDYLWWPLIGKPRQRRFRAQSPWGRFWEHYGE